MQFHRNSSSQKHLWFIKSILNNRQTSVVREIKSWEHKEKMPHKKNWSSKYRFGRSLIIQFCQLSLQAYISSTHCTIPASIILASLHLLISSISVILPLGSTAMGGLIYVLKLSLGFEPPLNTESQVRLYVRTGWASELVKGRVVWHNLFIIS